MKTHLGRIEVLAFVAEAVLCLSHPTSAATLPCTQQALRSAAQEVAPDASIIQTDNTSYPGVCVVTGFVTTTDPGPNKDLFQLGLPDPSTWNAKFLFVGNGGFAGSLQPGAASDVPVGQLALSTGYASATTDAGHESALVGTPLDPFVVLDGSWALNNVAAQDDFLVRGVHVTAQATEALTNAYYGVNMAQRYFDGCSDGGREGLIEAEFYPSDFDGIIAGDPVIDLYNMAAAWNWNAQSLFKTSKSWLAPQKITLLDRAVMRSCDAADGVIDGLIQDPGLCTFDPSSLECPKGESEGAAFRDSTCLSSEQVVALKAIYQGPVTRKGIHLYPGTTKSDPGGSDGNGWVAWITSSTKPILPVPANGEPWGIPPGSFPFASSQWSLQDQLMKYFVFSSRRYNSLKFNINNSNDLQALEEVLPAGAGLNPDLKRFLRDLGHKLIVYHGWSDQAPSPLVTVNYYQTMVNETFGDDQTNARNTARLFMVPGMHHCGGGPGPQIGEFDWLVPLDVWVTRGRAPDSIVGTNGARTMPLCAYPETAHYDGGPIDQASSWTCQLDRHR